VSEGDSLEEALDNVREAILLCLEVRRHDRLPPIRETPAVIAREIEACLRERAEEGLPLTIETREVEVEDDEARRPRHALGSGSPITVSSRSRRYAR